MNATRPRSGHALNAPRRTRARPAALALCAALATLAPAAELPGRDPLRALVDARVTWPTWGAVVRVATLQDHNTRVVVLGVSGLGLASGLIGTFLLLRKRALLGDALSHATLPGIGLAFILLSALGQAGKSLPALLAGATVSGVIGVLAILFIVHRTRLKEDAALGIVLSVFFGLGVALVGLIQSMDTGHAAGLHAFIYGKTAAMLLSDALTIAVAAGLVAAACAALFKELTLLCFDPAYARARGWPVVLLDTVLMALVVAVTVMGLQAVGLILMVALLVIPPAAARFWTHHLPTMLAVSAAIGAVSGLFGAALSALVPRLPAGAVIVLVAGVFFAVSMVCGPARGVLPRWLERRRLARKVARQNLLRALYELDEGARSRAGGPVEPPPVATAALLRARSWSPGAFRRALAAAEREGLVARTPDGAGCRLTAAGRQAARRVARNHRLWELYLITHADIAPSHVDRDADEVEHVLEPGLADRLESLLAARYPDLADPPSPHRLGERAAPGNAAGGG